MQRLRAIVAALRLNRVDRNSPSSDLETFGSWLKAHGQSDAAIARLFDVFTIATLNAPAAQVSLSLGAMVFQDGLLRKAAASDIGISRVPLSRLHGDAAAAVLAKHDIRLRTSVRSLTPLPGNRWRVDTDDTSLEVDAVVLAVPHDVAADLLPAGAIADPEVVRGLDVAPILNVHVIFDRVVLTEPFVAAVESPAQFVFDRTEQSGINSGQYVAVSVSAADEWIDVPVARLREVFLPELLKLLPAAPRRRGQRLLRHPRTRGHVSAGARQRRPAAPARHGLAGARRRRRLDRHRLAGHDGKRGPQRLGRRARTGAVARFIGRRTFARDVRSRIFAAGAGMTTAAEDPARPVWRRAGARRPGHSRKGTRPH